MTTAVPETPLATIALLTYNRAALLPRALASARAQDYPHLEILVLDNASTDGSEALCRAAAAADGRIRYLRQPRNVGPVANFNAGLAAAAGRYFMWLADDDWITPNYVSACVAVLERDPGVALAAGRAELPEETPDKRLPAPIDVRLRDPEARVLNYLWDPRENSIFYGLYRTDVVRRVGLKRVIAGDWLTVAAVATQGTLVTTAAATLYRSPAGSSASHRHAVRVLGAPGWHGRAPKIATATSIAGWFRREYPFADRDARGRRRLARRVFCVLAARKRMLRFLLAFVPRALRPGRGP